MPRPAKILGPDGRPVSVGPSPAHRRADLRGRYDAAQTTPENANHWANADAYSATAANSVEVRRTLRNRARYEVANNGYASGIVETIANDTIGTGPRLQIQTKDPEFNERVATEFEEWTAATGLAEKLRTLHQARMVDGESFALFITNPILPTPVKLDILPVEADQIATPYAYIPDARNVDGIEFDAYGNPAFYHYLLEHPGDLLHYGEYGKFDRLPASLVVHWFKVRRPGQKRGVSELAPCLPLFAQLRRYTLATLSAAEIAALFAALLKTTAPPRTVDDGEDGESQPPGIVPFETEQIVRGMMTALPDGYDVTQLRAEQPTTTYPAFKNELINEVARPLSAPFNVAAGNSSNYNYSSGRLDHQGYHRAIGVVRYFLETAVLDRLFRAWVLEARLADPALVEGIEADRLPRHRWGWDGFAHVDPEKEANAQTIRLANGTTTMEAECAEDGNDWRDVARQQAEERKFYASLGVPYPGDAAKPPAATPPTGPPDAAPGGPTNAEASLSTRTRIAATGAAAPDRLTIQGTGTVEIEAARSEDNRPTFAIVGYTGAPMKVDGFSYPVIVDLAGLKADSQQIPALRNHDTDRIVGMTDAIKIGSDVRLSGVITGDNADAQEVISQSKNGFKWQASIGANVVRREFLEAGKKATVNGREVNGPILIARQSVLQEISFVALGADGQTSASVAASISLGTPLQGSPMNFEQWLKAKGYDPPATPDSLKAVLRAAYSIEHPNGDTAAAAANGNAATTAAAAASTAGGASADPRALQTLDEIFAGQREENERVSEITRLTAAAVRDRPAMTDALERISRTAIEARISPRDFELELLRATRAVPGNFSVHAKDARTTGRVIEAAICQAGNLESAVTEKAFDDETLQSARDRFPQGITLVEVLTISARENGYTGIGGRDVNGLLRAAFPVRTDVRAEGFSTISLPGILGNVANKFLAAGFNAVEDTWRLVAARRAVNDFKAITTYTLTGGMMYEKVGPAGELKHATVGEMSYTNQIDSYGRLFTITRRDIINDDLGALTAVPKKLGRGAALKLNDVFWTVFLNNSTFFASGNANYISGGTTNLSLTSLTTAGTTFANQTDPDGYPLGITPKILLVPNAVGVLANNLMTSTMIANDTTANTQTLANNPFAGLYTVAKSAYLSNSNYTGYSTTAWYLLADPNDLPVIEVAFLNGRETPIVESADAEFDSLGIQFRGYFDFGAALQEYRAGVKSAGA